MESVEGFEGLRYGDMDMYIGVDVDVEVDVEGVMVVDKNLYKC